MPMVISHVCRRWRHCACSDPMLWRQLGIHDHVEKVPWSSRPVPSLRKLESHSVFLTTCALRAGSFPLTLSLDIYYEPQSSSQRSDLHRCIKMWRPILLRCKSLSLGLPGTTLHALFQITIELPLLESLALASPYDILYLRNMRAPMLNIISVQGCQRNLKIHGVDWSRLTSLTIQWIELGSEIAFILQECVALEHLDLVFEGVTIDGSTVISLPNVKDLALRFGDDDVELVDIFPCFSVPALKCFRLIAAPSERPLAGSVASMLTRSGCHLEQLEVNGQCFLDDTDNSDFGVLLKAAPSLKVLHIEGSYSRASKPVDDCLRWLIHINHDTGEIFAPKLQDLFIQMQVLEGESEYPWPSDVLVSEILTSRRHIPDDPKHNGTLESALIVVEDDYSGRQWRFSCTKGIVMHFCAPHVLTAEEEEQQRAEQLAWTEELKRLLEEDNDEGRHSSAI
ncbi:hypothetical protein OE88DRAFT_1812345 [Heliocybe sulcata]|uniref:F-box domain-containing protein n=1 Tax=Heliocybe sulcata TaxID=5364 RepID=A0A5C3MKC3_9AGAM|nr:hypothetical protein OE88DRAFT_1812345 [Heliocybe sulcata]